MIDKRDLDANITNEELTRVSNALDALASTNEQPNQEQWRNIMEESNNRASKVSSRTKYLSIAASFLIVALISTIVAMQLMSNDVDVAEDNNPIETVPIEDLTPEEALLANTILLNAIEENEGIEAMGLLSADIFDTTTGNIITESDLPWIELYSTRNGVLSFGYNAYECFGGNAGRDVSSRFDTLPPGEIFNFATGKFTRSNASIEIPSNDGSRKALIERTCNENNTLKIVGENGNTIVELKPELGDSFPYDVDGSTPFGPGIDGQLRTAISSLVWINNDTALVNVNTVTVVANGTESNPRGDVLEELNFRWKILDVNEDKSLSDLNDISFQPDFWSGYDENSYILDVISERNRTLLLTNPVDITSEESARLEIVDLATGEVVRTITPRDVDEDAVSLRNVRFGSTSNQLYGSFFTSESEAFTTPKAFGYDITNDVVVKPKGGLLIPIR